MLAYFCSDDIVESIRAEGFDPDELFDVYVKAIMIVLPADLLVCILDCISDVVSFFFFSFFSSLLLFPSFPFFLSFCTLLTPSKFLLLPTSAVLMSYINTNIGNFS